MSKKKYEIITFDYRDVVAAMIEVEEAIKKFGLEMYELPSCVGTDQFAYVISNEVLEDKEITEINDHTFHK